MLAPDRVRNGVNYYDLLNSPGTTHVSACIFNETQKYTLPDSTFSIQAVTHSYKYDKELQFVSWSRTPPRLERRTKDDSEFFRFECGYMELSRESAQALRDVANKIDAILDAEEYTPPHKPQPAREIHNLAEIMTYG